MAKRVDLKMSNEWGFANQMTLFSTSFNMTPNTSSVMRPSKQMSSKGNQLVDYKCVKPNLYSNPFSRSLLSESMSVFKSLQRISENREPLSKNELIKGSRRYRSVIHSCFFNLINTSDQELSENSLSMSLSNMFCQMEIVWNLCEILYIDVHNNGFLLNQLLVWIKWHFTQTNQMAISVTSKDMPSIDPNYWNVIMSYLLRGDTENARYILEMHSNANDRQEFVVLRDLIHKMPIISNNYVLHEFYLRWQSWRDDCEQKLSEGVFDVNPTLKLIARLMVGEVEAFKEVLHLFEAWYHLMVSFLLFTDPLIKENSLSDLCHKCIQMYSSKANQRSSPSLDAVITSAFSYDLIGVIQESSSCFDDNWWFATHFVDLLYNANELSPHIEFPKKFREFFVLEYANSLMTFDNLWQFGVEYLSQCMENGLHYIELNLQRVAIDDENSAQKVIYFANRFGLNYITKSVCKVLARKWLSRQRLGSALFWAIRSEDSSLTNHISNLFLIEYNKRGEFPDEDILSNSGRFMLISDRLTFLAKYYEFHQLVKECQYESSAQLLVSLLVSNIAPKFFIIRLLMDSLPLLETQNIVFNADQTAILLSSLEEMLSFGHNRKDDEINMDFLKEREDILRLAIARNLARNYVLQTN